MSARTRRVAAVVGGLALGALAGCARLAPGDPADAMARSPAADVTALEGVWVGQIWETPADNFQGVRRVTVNIAGGGAWTATIGGVVCGRGVATTRDDLVILASRAPGGPPCVPYSMEQDRGRMWGEFTTAFGRRAATAAIDLVRVRERRQEAAGAASPR